jgi:hypothetical protein
LSFHDTSQHSARPTLTGGTRRCFFVNKEAAPIPLVVEPERLKKNECGEESARFCELRQRLLDGHVNANED